MWRFCCGICGHNGVLGLVCICASTAARDKGMMFFYHHNRGKGFPLPGENLIKMREREIVRGGGEEKFLKVSRQLYCDSLASN